MSFVNNQTIFFNHQHEFLRYLKHLKNNVRNKAKVEGSMCNAYLVEEITSFCFYYFKDHIATLHNQGQRNEDDAVGLNPHFVGDFSIFTYPGPTVGTGKEKFLTEPEYEAVHTYILLNCLEASSSTNNICWTGK
ncbi:hypothetical protein Scep_001546 [Stephania cephalantha]|uniref:DUF4218 domain-containing protein n=1 Tax=Stephania cephalantha TaxID=152367 RepID=A0AAP0L995_9MAGN